MTPDDLERLTTRRLASLPGPRAPHSLLPRVMAAVAQVVARPWYARTWFTWPLAGQVASLALVLVVVGGLSWLSPGLDAALASANMEVSARVLAPVAEPLAELRSYGLAARVFWHSGLQLFVGILFVPVLLMFAACAAFGVALDRVALGGASRS